MANQVGTERPQTQARSSILALSLGALGVVYGDIGTSPLYALRECFDPSHHLPITSETVLGILSLLFWVLVLIISVKYMVVVMRADNRGEGGILALMALANTGRKKMHPVVMVAGIFGAALLYGDGAITPAISVLSAVEGLKVATTAFTPFVLPITAFILIGLFVMQKFGTAKIGAVFGPVMLVWFFTLGILGVRGILLNPEVLYAVNPMYAIRFFYEFKEIAFFVLGAVFLVLTGGEALYADMGHFGKRPIRIAWFYLVLPALMLNYFGQGALLLSRPETAENPFFLLAPDWALYPLVGLSMGAAVIASQALISGVFSLTRQAIQLGFSPRMQIIHTSSREIGQIYLPLMNWGLLVAALYLVFTFRSSSNLASAYGISVATTMVITTLLLYVVARRLWKWPLWVTCIVMAIFGLVDLSFWAANIVKIEQGGWFPLAVGSVIFICMTTWRRGRQILAERLRVASLPLQDFLEKVKSNQVGRVRGTAVFMVGDPETVPPALLHNVKHNKILHEIVIVLTVLTKEVPFVPRKDRALISEVAPGFYKVVAQYGFMDTPNVQKILSICIENGVPVSPQDLTFFLGRETLIASENPGMAIWREHLFSFMSRNAQRATTFFALPADQVIEVGMQVEL